MRQKKSTLDIQLTASILRAFHQNLPEWFIQNRRDLPWRRNRNTYTTTVSELMLQQTQVTTVIPYFNRWLEKFPSWPELAQASEEKVLKAWEGLGYYRRARFLHALAKVVTYEYKGKLPNDVATLQKLPGIGPYTAGAISSLAYNQSSAILDGNIERVLCRVFNLSLNVSESKNKKALFSLSSRLLPPESSPEPRIFNEALMELGALVCSPRKPQCLICPLQEICQAKDPEKIPVKSRMKTIPETMVVPLVEKQGKLLILEPSESGRWKGFHRFPFYDQKAFSLDEKFATFTFNITKYKITAHLHHAQLNTAPKPQPFIWLSPEELTQLPLPNPQRKILMLYKNKVASQ
ncbi:MAG: A/G-specific adenine glycosylase [Verrucomicrobiota bacterium]